MTTVTQMKCACKDCLCIVSLEQAIQKNSQYYCSQSCADGHPNGHGDCGHNGCTC